MYTFTRRALLRTLAGTTFAATTLRRWEAWGQAAQFPKRLLILCSSAGRDDESRCTGTGTGYTLSAGYAALAPWRSRVTILDGLRIPAHVSEEHPDGRCSMLTARQAGTNGARGPSIDRFVASALTNGQSIFGGPPGTRATFGSIDQPVSWQATGVPNDAYLEGQALLTSLFPGGTTPTPPVRDAGVVPPADDRALVNEYALQQHLTDELARLRRVAPRDDLEKLDLHLAALQQLRATLPPLAGPGGSPDAGVPGGGGTATLPACAPSIPGALTGQDATHLTVAHAFACGRSRIAVLRLGGDEPIHTWSHWQDSSTYRAQLRAQDRSNAEAFARLLGYLDGFKEGAGSVLTNTLVVWTTEVSGGYGQTGDIHDVQNMPFVLAGGLQGAFKVGQRINAPGRTCGELYRTVAQVMGVPGAASFGDQGFGGPLLPDVLT